MQFYSENSESKVELKFVQPLVAQNILLGISEYQLTEVLPKEFQSSLPTIKQIEDEFNDV